MNADEIQKALRGVHLAPHAHDCDSQRGRFLPNTHPHKPRREEACNCWKKSAKEIIERARMAELFP